MASHTYDGGGRFVHFVCSVNAHVDMLACTYAVCARTLCVCSQFWHENHSLIDSIW